MRRLPVRAKPSRMAGIVLEGAYTAIVTPFTSDRSAVDWDAFERHVEAQIAGGISGLVPCGTTGESPTLSMDEHAEVVARTVKIVAGRVPVLAGAGSNSTHETIHLCKAADAAGADALMVVNPYYNKPSQAGLVRHVELVAAEVDKPIVLYNIPARSAVELSVDTILTLLDRCPNVVGVKDATGNVSSCQQLLRRAGDRVQVMSGDDPLTLALMSVGARGVISVTSNLLPGQVDAVVRLAQRGEWKQARARHFALLPVHAAAFCEPSPAAVKGTLAKRGVMNDVVRPPMFELTAEGHETIASALADYEAAAS